MRQHLYKLFSILALSLTLQACAGLLLVGLGAAIGGVVIHEGRTIDTKAQDFKISQEAYKRLSLDSDIHKKAHVIVSSYDGVVLLVGQVHAEAVRTRAEGYIRSIKGVKRVYNEITISGPVSPMTQSSDSWITTKVKSILLATKDLDSSQIKVTTENGIVYLMGRVTRGQATIASDQARTVAGVQKVVTLFEYIQ